MGLLSVRVLAAGLAFAGGLSAAPINLVSNPSFESDIVSPLLQGSVDGTNAWHVFSPVTGWGSGYPNYGVELQRNNLYPFSSNSATGNNAWDGQQWAELDVLLPQAQGATPQIFQDIATTSGATYLLSFYYAPRPDAGAQELGVFWGNSSAIFPSFIGSASGVGGSPIEWVRYDFTLTASSTSMRLGFGSLENLILFGINSGAGFAGGNLLDLVTLTLAPADTTAGGTTAGGTTAGGTTAGDTTVGDVPEPGTYASVAAGLAGLYLLRKRSNS